jgi:hypothetical protein
MRKPDYYATPLRKRADIEAALRNWPGARNRGWHNYPGTSSDLWRFCFNVKAYGVDFGFDNLLARFRECGHAETLLSDPGYLARCRAKLEELEESTLWDWAQEDAWRTFIGCEECKGCRYGSKPDDYGYNGLWYGTEVSARFSSGGRSSDWLILTEFDGHKLTTDLEFSEMDFATLRKFYSYVVMLTADLERCPAKRRLEDAAAFALFDNVCADVPAEDPATTRLRAKVIAAENFVARMAERGLVRGTGAQLGTVTHELVNLLLEEGS